MLSAQTEHQTAPAPRHIAIIMDGNGRWARARNLPRIAGHRRGAEAVRKTVRACREMGVAYLTLYAFSSENWTRPAEEVDDLMALLRVYLRREIEELHKNDIRISFIGDRAPLAPDIIALIDEAEGRTRANQAMSLIIALNYGAQSEIVQAARRIAADAVAGRIRPEEVDEALFSRYLYTAGVPDPDLIIRTSGEKRLSNFLLWQSAYAELVFLDIYWPDFDRDSLMRAIEEFHSRERRYGASRG